MGDIFINPAGKSPYSIFEVYEDIREAVSEGRSFHLSDGSIFHPQQLILLNPKDLTLYFKKHKRAGEIAPQVLKHIPEDIINDRLRYQQFVGMSILTEQAFNMLAAICRTRGLISIGAGSGFTEFLLREEGVEVTAIDTKELLKDSSYRADWDLQDWSDIVEYGTGCLAEDYSDRVLMLSWPEFETDMAVDALRSHNGDTLIYIGEERNGACANDEFFDYLESYFTVVTMIPLKSFFGSVDSMFVLRRTNNTKRNIIDALPTAQWITMFDQQYVGAWARGEQPSTDLNTAVIQLRAGGFISWLTMNGVAFEDVVDVVRSYGPGDITAKLDCNESFGTSMINLLRDLQEEYDC